jgi:hypothetical protein
MRLHISAQNFPRFARRYQNATPSLGRRSRWKGNAWQGIDHTTASEFTQAEGVRETNRGSLERLYWLSHAEVYAIFCAKLMRELE